MTSKKKKKYFPNNWKAIHDTPSESFELPDGGITFEEFMDWKVGGYELPATHVAMLRVRNLDTGKVKEYVYKYRHAAIKKCRKLINEGNKEITVVQPDAVHFIDPRYDEIFT